MAEDIDFKYPMKRACTAEIGRFCGGVEHGHARVIRCLQDHVDEPDMASECKEEITRDQIRSNHDYRCAPAAARAPAPAPCRPAGPARAHAARPRAARQAGAPVGAQAELPPERGVRGGHRRAVHRGVQPLPGPGVRWARAALPNREAGRHHVQDLPGAQRPALGTSAARLPSARGAVRLGASVPPKRAPFSGTRRAESTGSVPAILSDRGAGPAGARSPGPARASAPRGHRDM